MKEQEDATMMETTIEQEITKKTTEEAITFRTLPTVSIKDVVSLESS